MSFSRNRCTSIQSDLQNIEQSTSPDKAVASYCTRSAKKRQFDRSLWNLPRIKQVFDELSSDSLKFVICVISLIYGTVTGLQK